MSPQHEQYKYTNTQRAECCKQFASKELIQSVNRRWGMIVGQYYAG